MTDKKKTGLFRSIAIFFASLWREIVGPAKPKKEDPKRINFHQVNVQMEHVLSSGPHLPNIGKDGQQHLLARDDGHTDVYRWNGEVWEKIHDGLPAVEVKPLITVSDKPAVPGQKTQLEMGHTSNFGSPNQQLDTEQTADVSQFDVEKHYQDMSPARRQEAIDVVNRVMDNLELDPEIILGPDYGKNKFRFDHPDDKFVPFAATDAVAVADPDFFFDYVSRKLSEEDKVKYPAFFYPCFVEKEELINLCAGYPPKEIYQDERQYAIFLIHQSTFGLLLMDTDTAIDISRANAGFDSTEESRFYHLQFMRFDQEALTRLDIGEEIQALYETYSEKGNLLRLNFATFNHDKETNESDNAS